MKRRQSRHQIQNLQETIIKHLFTVLAAAAGITLAAAGAHAQKKYDEGASDTEIKFGQTAPYSGPASSYGTIGKLQLAYFKKVNDGGGIHGRKLNMISLDDGYNPAKTVEMVRRLVEQENVLFLFGNVGSPPNSAIQKYVHGKKIPHVFHSSGANKWNDPKHFPWSMAFTPNYQTEGRIYAEHIASQRERTMPWKIVCMKAVASAIC